jgi:large subunit ribosomal protein L14e
MKMEIGQVCIKTRGRKAGLKCKVVSKVTNGKVIIEGKNMKKKECNILHLFPLKGAEKK